VLPVRRIPGGQGRARRRARGERGAAGRARDLRGRRSPGGDDALIGPPITERILDRLGRPRWLWVLLWSLVPLISPLVFGGAIRLSGQPIGTPEFADLAATQAVLAYACLVFLAGTALLAREAVVAQEDVRRLAPGERSADLFGAIGDARGPLLLTAIVAFVISAGGWATYGPLPPLAALPPLLVYMLPIQTFVWVYLVILAGLDRLGRRPLVLDAFPEDRTLGLEKLGSLASTGLGLLFLAIAPLLVAGGDEPVTLGISLAIVAIIVALFLLSMWRLHRQMLVSKAKVVELASRLYADAYAPLRAEPTVATLEAQAAALRAAQSLDERARGLPTWPIDEAAVRITVVIVSGVVSSLIVRGLFAALAF
jgi:hypothetical protein